MTTNKNLVPVRKLNVAENIELARVTSSEMYQNTAFVAAAGSEVGRVLTTSTKEGDKIKRSFKRSKFKPSIEGVVDMGMRVNAILGVVSVLKEVGSDFDGALAVYANDTIVNDYLDGSAHRIVATGMVGRNEASAEELTAWALLSSVISEVGVLRVRLLPISEATIKVYNKEAGRRVRVEEDSPEFAKAAGYKQFNHKMAAKAWDLVQESVRKKTERAEEVIVEENYEDDAAV